MKKISYGESNQNKTFQKRGFDFKLLYTLFWIEKIILEFQDKMVYY